MEPDLAEKLRFTLETGGWTQVMEPMLQQRLTQYNRLLIANPDQRTAGYIEALMYVLAWPRQSLTQYDEDRIVKPPSEPESVGDPYRDTANS